MDQYNPEADLHAPVLGCTTAAIELRNALALYLGNDVLPEELSEDDTLAIKQAVLEYFAAKREPVNPRYTIRYVN